MTGTDHQNVQCMSRARHFAGSLQFYTCIGEGEYLTPYCSYVHHIFSITVSSELINNCHPYTYAEQTMLYSLLFTVQILLCKWTHRNSSQMALASYILCAMLFTHVKYTVCQYHFNQVGILDCCTESRYDLGDPGVL